MIVATGTESATLIIEVPAEDITAAIVKRSCIELLGKKYQLKNDGSGITLDNGKVKEIDVSFALPPLPNTVSTSELFEKMTKSKDHYKSCLFIRELGELVPDALASFHYQGSVSQWRFCAEPSNEAFDLDELLNN
jgi:hypothetical protein